MTTKGHDGMAGAGPVSRSSGRSTVRRWLGLVLAVLFAASACSGSRVQGTTAGGGTGSGPGTGSGASAGSGASGGDAAAAGASTDAAASGTAAGANVDDAGFVVPTGARAAQVQQAFGEGSAAFARGDFVAAATAFRRVYDAFPSPEMAFNVARAYDRQGEVAPALEYYQRALSDSTPPQQRQTIERQVAALRAYQERLRTGVAQPPPSSDALTQEGLTWFQRGLALFGRRQYRAAQMAFEQAHQYTQTPELYFNLAVTYERLNDIPHALEFLREYLSRRRGTAEQADIERRIHALEARQ